MTPKPVASKERREGITASGTTAVQEATLSVASNDPGSHGEGLACTTSHRRGSVQ